METKHTAITVLDAGGSIVGQYCTSHEADIDLADLRRQGYEIRRDLAAEQLCTYCGAAIAKATE